MVNFLLDPIVNATTPRGIYDVPSSVFSGGMSAIDVVSLPALSLSSFPVPTVGRSFYGSVFFPSHASAVSTSMGLWGDRWYDSDLMFTGALLASRDGLGFGLSPLGPYSVYPTYPFFALPPLQISEFKMPPVGNFMRMSGDPAASEQPSSNDHSVTPPPPSSGPPPAYDGADEGAGSGSAGNGAVSQGRRRRARNTRGGDPRDPPPDSAQGRQLALGVSGLQPDVEAQIKQALKAQLGDGQIFSVYSFHRDDPRIIFVSSNSSAYPLRKNHQTGQWSIENPIGTVKDSKLLIPEGK